VPERNSTASAGLSHGGAEGTAAHRTTTFLNYIAQRNFGLKEEGSEGGRILVSE
jgi:hypothetical protein